jgi:macrolide-specific efflux system membrane fusion protein
LYDGVSVTANIVYQRVPDALTVPSAAVTTSKGASTVTRAVDGKNVTTPVTVGEVVGQLTQITKGLASGDQVVVRVTLPPTSGGTGSTGTNRQGGFAPGSGQFPGGGFGRSGGTGGGTGGGTSGGAVQNGGGKNG